MTSADVVCFYLPERGALGGINPLTLDVDRDWAVFGTGVYVWILQTFLRLNAAGTPVRLVETPPADGLVVVHASQLEQLLSEAPDPPALTIVAARSDKPRQVLADFEIVQNGWSVEKEWQFFIPSWLQPGLVPRDPARGTRVEEIAFFGSLRELHEDLAAPRWGDDLRQRGLTWRCHGITFDGNDRHYSDHRWNDYATVDAVVALRPPAAWNARSKPAAKLQNAWAAGTPAVLSPERSYRELRRSDLDYLEARSSSDALAAIDRLRTDPALYQAMVSNGLQRARDFSAERLVARWTQVLWEEILPKARTPRHRLLARARKARGLLRRLRARSERGSFLPSP
jgi:hypothetical protein